MPHLLLAPFRSMAARVMVCAVLCGAVAGCSSTTGGGGATTGYLGYVFAEDFELERRYLHLPKTPEFITHCLYQDLPPSDNVEWKEIQLDPGVHRAVVLLLEDPDNAEHFESDTDAFEEVEPRVCLARPGDIDFCYAPAMLASTVTTPIFIWQFGLTPEFTLSMQSQELIDAFLAAHDECWQNGAPAPGYGGNP